MGAGPGRGHFVFAVGCGTVAHGPWNRSHRSCLRDLDSAAARYESLGFTVGARNKHSWCAHNRIVQFDSVFIELLTLAEPDKLGDDGFSRLFGAYTGDFLTRGEGLALLILESRDARSDEAQFRAAGVAISEDMTFEREGKRPDGASVKVGFSLAFAEDKKPHLKFTLPPASSTIRKTSGIWRSRSTAIASPVLPVSCWWPMSRRGTVIFCSSLAAQAARATKTMALSSICRVARSRL
jgi:hypothetical protein